MLVLSRKVNEKIKIGEDVYITIVAVHGQSVRVGIDAPAELGVSRIEPTPEEVAATTRDKASRQAAGAARREARDRRSSRLSGKMPPRGDQP